VSQAAFEMSNHLTQAEIEAFWARGAETAVMTRIAGHISNCDACREVASEVRQGTGKVAGTSIDLDVGSWLQSEHLNYEEKRGYIDGLTDLEEREIAEQHLSICTGCREDMTAFLEDRRENDSMLSIRHLPPEALAPATKASVWPIGGLWSPARAAALMVLALGLGVVFGRTDSWKRTLQFLRAEQRTAPFGKDRSAEAADQLAALKARQPGVVSTSSAATPEASPERTVGAEDARVTLKDHGHRVVVEPRLTGLSGTNDAELEAITEALVAEDIPLPAIVADLWGAEGALRGERLTQFDLMRPRREVVRQARPTFRWRSLKDASGYQVFIVDSKRAAVLASARLGPEVTQWRPGTPLVRGEAYSWSVSASIRGEEVISPGPAEAEWKFRVLAENEHRRLRRIEARTNSHLARGVLYARAGLISEAQSELQMLLDENQDSGAVRRLLERVRSWR